jgi:SWI/SNF-related matrix-associated actin-dependent regulator 1 of chromatin subfamily A
MMPVAKDPIPAVEPTRIPRPRRVEVVVLGNDEFLIELGPLLGDGFRTRPVDSPAGVAAAMAEQSGGGETPPAMIMLDAATQADARAAVAQMEAAHPNMPIIVIAASRDESYWGAAIARGAIIDVIARYDLGGDQFKAALNRAETRARSAPQTPPPGQVAPPSKSNSKLLIGAAVAVALGVSAWFMIHKSGPAGGSAAKSSATAASSAAPVAQKAVSTVELLSAARIAFRDQKLLPRTDGEPRGDSALELYAQVLAEEPKNDEAIDGLQRLFSVIKSRVQADLAANKLDDAQKVLNAFKATNVEADGARELDGMITAARPKYYAARAQEMIAANDFNGAEQMIQQLATLDRTAAAELHRSMDARKAEQAQVAQLQQLSASVKTAIESGNLLDPANDNARSRLQAMRQISRNHPLTLGAQRDLQAALINRAQEQSSKEQFDSASKLLAAAGEIGQTSEVAEAKRQLQTDVEAANQRAASAAAAKKAAEAALANAGADSAAAANAAAANTFIAARPTTPLKVVYPSAAADNRVQGYAIVEFMLQADGRPSQPTIVESNPAHIFDSAAIEAVMGAKYDTSKLIEKNPRRARVRLTFKPG